jgi:The Golgi pH Regulator (GPHR) Family N-terminal
MAAIARHRPIGITILAILAGLAALVAIWHTLQYLHILPFTLGPLQFYGFDLLGALLWAVTAAIWIWAAVNLWNVQPQGLLFATWLSGLNLVLDALSILGASTFQALLPSILLNGIILIYCLSPGVRRAFGTA